MRKYYPVIINIGLFVAVVVLYVLYFTQKNGSTGPQASDSPAISFEQGAIAYINVDTLQAHLDMFFDYQKDLLGKQQSSQTRYENRVRELQRSVADYQDKMQKGLITRSQAAEIEQKLQGEEQKIMALRENLAYELQEETLVLNRQIMNELMTYLEEYNKDKNYRFIIQNTYGGVLLLADNSSNITSDVIKGLNEKYNKSKEKSKK